MVNGKPKYVTALGETDTVGEGHSKHLDRASPTLAPGAGPKGRDHTGDGLDESKTAYRQLMCSFRFKTEENRTKQLLI